MRFSKACYPTFLCFVPEFNRERFLFVMDPDWQNTYDSPEAAAPADFSPKSPPIALVQPRWNTTEYVQLTAVKRMEFLLLLLLDELKNEDPQQLFCHNFRRKGPWSKYLMPDETQTHFGKVRRLCDGAVLLQTLAELHKRLLSDAPDRARDSTSVLNGIFDNGVGIATIRDVYYCVSLSIPRTFELLSQIQELSDLTQTHSGETSQSQISKDAVGRQIYRRIYSAIHVLCRWTGLSRHQMGGIVASSRGLFVASPGALSIDGRNVGQLPCPIPGQWAALQDAVEGFKKAGLADKASWAARDYTQYSQSNQLDVSSNAAKNETYLLAADNISSASEQYTTLCTYEDFPENNVKNADAYSLTTAGLQRQCTVDLPSGAHPLVAAAYADFLFCYLNKSKGDQASNNIPRCIDASGATCVIIVEKESVFNDLTSSSSNLLNRFPGCILITGRGMPDLATRCFASFLSLLYPQLPFYGFCDHNASGLSILCQYKFGGIPRIADNLIKESLEDNTGKTIHIKNSHRDLLNMTTTIPRLLWIGIHARDVTHLLPAESQEPTRRQICSAYPQIRHNTSRDVALLKNISDKLQTGLTVIESYLKRREKKRGRKGVKVKVVENHARHHPFVLSARCWLQEAQDMLRHGYNADIEAVESQSLDCIGLKWTVVDFLLQKLMNGFFF